MKKLPLLLSLIGILTLSGCGGGGDNSSSNKPEPDNPSQPTEKEFSEAKLSDEVVTYDGKEHTLNVTGAPEGTTITYEGEHSFVNVGFYQIKATLTKEGYKTKTLVASLKIQKAEFDSVVFNDKTVVFDGEKHSLEATNLPENTEVTYHNNSNVDAGTYEVSVDLKNPNYNDKTLYATLTIDKAEMGNFTFEDAKIEYDGLDHKNDMQVIGLTDDSAEVTYSYKNEKGEEVTELIEVGTYECTATITSKNYKTKTITATLNIIAKEREQFITLKDDSIYFNNQLDGTKLYKVHSNAEVNRVSGDVAKHFVTYKDKKAFISEASIFTSIKTIDSDDKIETIYTGAVDKLVSNGNDLYFANNSLTNDKSGIFKLNVGAEEVTASKIYTGKTKYLTYCDNNLYFSDSKNGGKLSSIPLAGSTTPTLVVDEKVENIVTNGTDLVFSVKNLAGSYLAKYSTSKQEFKKLTIDNGKYINVDQNNVYYSNTDIFSSTVYGKGIYKIPLDGTFLNKPGTKIIDGDANQISSLCLAFDALYYYKVNDKHLYTCDMEGANEIDLLANFVIPEYIPLTMGGKTLAYNNKIYYTNIYDDKALYAYDERTLKSTKLTPNKVKDFYIYNDNLYINAVSYFVNNDLYVTNLKTNNGFELLSKNDATSMVSDGEYLYYGQNNAVGAKTSLNRINLTTKEEAVVFTKGVDNLQLVDDKLYFLEGSDICYLTKETLKTATDLKEVSVLNSEIKHVKQFYIDGNELIYTYNFLAKKEIRNYDLTAKTEKVIVSKATDPLEFIVDGNDIYYYTQAESAGVDAWGIYKTTRTSVDGEQTLVLANDSTYYASSISISGNTLYFVNYYLGGTLGDSHIYALTIGTKTPIAIDK